MTRLFSCDLRGAAIENRLEITTGAENAIAWMLLSKSRFQCVTPILQALHWLPVIFKAQFKAWRLLLTKALYSMVQYRLSEGLFYLTKFCLAL